MNIIMFSFLDELSGDGCRVITSMLKERGHGVKSVYMPFFGTQEGVTWDQELENCLEHADLFMLSLLSCYESRGAEVTRYLRSKFPDVPVVWGGVHATALPEACLKHADYVMRGECEHATMEFVDRLERNADDLLFTPNLAYLDEDGKLVQNPLEQLPFELDELPFPDYDLEDHFVLDGDQIVKANTDVYAKLHATLPGDNSAPAYYIITTRGCPFVCSYCHQSELVTTYPTKEYKTRVLRYKSVERSIEEAKQALERFPFFQEICFSDDDFFCRKLDEIKEFAEVYKREIGRPFGVAAIPISIKEEKLQVLLDAGLNKIQIGVQSGSDRVNTKIYERRLSRPKLIEAVKLLDRYRKKYEFELLCDWIIDCPWENEDDVYETVDLALQIPKWATFNVFTLTFYPGTVIWDRALEEGLIKVDENCYEQAFNLLKQEGHTYMNHVFILHSRMRYLPNWFIRALASKPARAIGGRLPHWVLNDLWRQKIFPKVYGWVNGMGKKDPEVAVGEACAS